MAKLTKQERVIRLLITMGYTECQSRSSKYVKYEKSGKPNIWIGSKGALRSGETIANSISMTHHLPLLFKKYNI